MLKKHITYIFMAIMLIFGLSGCSKEQTGIPTISIIYGITAFVSLLLVIGYYCLTKKKEIWLFLLYIAVFIVNAGYFSLSVSKTLEEALLANRISYLGSVFLPLCMFMTIMNVCKISYKSILPGILIAISVIVFIIAASPGYSDWYYKSAKLVFINGSASLDKVYGVLHNVYFIYLTGYFSAMICVAAYSVKKKNISCGSHAAILSSAVLGNILVWGIEQLIELPFEFLSVTYILTELFLLSLCVMIEYNESQKYEKSNQVQLSDLPIQHNESVEAEQCDISSDSSDANYETSIHEGYLYFCKYLPTLTPTEYKVYELYSNGKRSKEILEILSITENTLKTHNKRIYSKLGISSRKQLLEYSKLKKQADPATTSRA